SAVARPAGRPRPPQGRRQGASILTHRNAEGIKTPGEGRARKRAECRADRPADQAGKPGNGFGRHLPLLRRPRSDEMSKPWQPLNVLIAAEQAGSISGGRVALAGQPENTAPHPRKLRPRPPWPKRP